MYLDTAVSFCILGITFGGFLETMSRKLHVDLTMSQILLPALDNAGLSFDEGL